MSVVLRPTATNGTRTGAATREPSHSGKKASRWVAGIGLRRPGPSGQCTCCSPRVIPPLCQSTTHFRSGLLPCWRHGMPRPAVGQSSTRQTRRFWLRPGLDATEGGRGLTCHSPVSLAGVGPGTTGGGRRPHAGPERRVPGPGGPHGPVRGRKVPVSGRPGGRTGDVPPDGVRPMAGAADRRDATRGAARAPTRDRPADAAAPGRPPRRLRRRVAAHDPGPGHAPGRGGGPAAWPRSAGWSATWTAGRWASAVRDQSPQRATGSVPSCCPSGSRSTCGTSPSSVLSRCRWSCSSNAERVGSRFPQLALNLVERG